MAGFIDLHIHTVCSDGTVSPVNVLAKAQSTKLAAFSITDHDTMAGYHEIKPLLVTGDPELIPGVELSVMIGDDDVHVLGYAFDPENQEMKETLAFFQQKRNHRGRQIVEKLKGLGIDIPFDAVLETAGSSVIGRPHIAETMFRLKKVSSYEEAFEKYISRYKPAYVPKMMFEPKPAIDLVHRAGGVAVLAHPFIDDMIRHLDMLVHLGIDGLEVRHPNHTPDQTIRLEKKAKSHNLIPTGGSDFHGREGRHGMIGSQKVPEEYLKGLNERVQEIRGKM